MSNWEDFATSSSIGPSDLTVAEDRAQIRSADDYALFQELTFLKVCDEFLKPPPAMKAQYLKVQIHPMTSYAKHTLRTKKLTFAYHGYNKVLWGSVIVSETAYPRGYRITKLLRGEKGSQLYHPGPPNKWISWREAVTSMFSDDLSWT